uniref:Uncharacterized protein n=1 Tax=Oryza rufipogon TaxID=4529 RepID=A0A0E0NR62_ORYRU
MLISFWDIQTSQTAQWITVKHSNWIKIKQSNRIRFTSETEVTGRMRGGGGGSSSGRGCVQRSTSPSDANGTALERNAHRVFSAGRGEAERNNEATTPTRRAHPLLFRVVPRAFNEPVVPPRWCASLRTVVGPDQTAEREIPLPMLTVAGYLRSRMQKRHCPRYPNNVSAMMGTGAGSQRHACIVRSALQFPSTAVPLGARVPSHARSRLSRSRVNVMATRCEGVLKDRAFDRNVHRVFSAGKVVETTRPPTTALHGLHPHAHTLRVLDFPSFSVMGKAGKCTAHHGDGPPLRMCFPPAPPPVRVCLQHITCILA